MTTNVVKGLKEIGFSEYEAKAYTALLRKSPVTGYELSKISGVPRSMIYEVLGKLKIRGAILTLHKEGTTRHAPVPAKDFLDHVHREQEALFTALLSDIASIYSESEFEYVWTLEGRESILARAMEMILGAANRIHVALAPETLEAIRSSLEEAVRKGIQVAVYTDGPINLPGASVVIASMPEEAWGKGTGLGMILVIDGSEVLIGERLDGPSAHASYTSSPLLVFIVEHHIRTDPYLPRIFSLLDDRDLEFIRPEDRNLFLHGAGER